MKKPPGSKSTLQVIRGGLFLNAIIWLVFSIVTLLRPSLNPDQALGMVILAILMVGNAGAFLICGITISRKSIFFYVITIIVLIVNIILTVTDQIGALDVITFLIDLAILVLLIVNHKQLLQKGS